MSRMHNMVDIDANKLRTELSKRDLKFRVVSRELGYAGGFVDEILRNGRCRPGIIDLLASKYMITYEAIKPDPKPVEPDPEPVKEPDISPVAIEPEAQRIEGTLALKLDVDELKTVIREVLADGSMRELLVNLLSDSYKKALQENFEERMKEYKKGR